MPSPKVLSSARDDWQTPPEIVKLIEKFNDGPIGLDPCGAPSNPAGAVENWYPPADGLKVPWPSCGTFLTFVNPPFSAMRFWASKVAFEAERGVEIIMLCVPRTDTAWFRQVWSASALAFWHGNGEAGDPLRGSRLRFVNPATGEPATGNTSPSLFAYWGPRSMRFGRIFSPYARIIFP